MEIEQSLRGKNQFIRRSVIKLIYTLQAGKFSGTQRLSLANSVGYKWLNDKLLWSYKNFFTFYRRQNPKMAEGFPPSGWRGDLCLPGNRTQQKSWDFVVVIKVPNQLV